MQPRSPISAATALILALAAAVPSVAAAACGLNVNPGALDTNRNAELSREETRGTVLAAVFDKVDANGDGVIGQPEYARRCQSLGATRQAPSRPQDTAGQDPETEAADEDKKAAESGWEDTAVGKAAQRQAERQQNRVNDRVNQETQEAADKAVEDALDSLFGD